MWRHQPHTWLPDVSPALAACLRLCATMNSTCTWRSCCCPPPGCRLASVVSGGASAAAAVPMLWPGSRPLATATALAASSATGASAVVAAPAPAPAPAGSAPAPALIPTPASPEPAPAPALPSAPVPAPAPVPVPAPLLPLPCPPSPPPLPLPLPRPRPPPLPIPSLSRILVMRIKKSIIGAGASPSMWSPHSRSLSWVGRVKYMPPDTTRARSAGAGLRVLRAGTGRRCPTCRPRPSYGSPQSRWACLPRALGPMPRR